ncbi:MAG TPA: patatin-like phospholipase family protein, partial [Candidatus Methylomirabilis sp.]|nr:patatin-like phospholipase family protein [Candidatus Methylomirabilis sp.]
MTVGLVLGGGGARGTFEIGALNCLFTQFAIEPTIISGCSAGALIAAKLAEGRTLAHFVEATVALRDFVLSLTRDEIFVKQPWFQSLDHTSLGATFESMFKHRPHEAAHHLHHTHGFAGMLALELVQFLPRAPAAIQELRRHSSSLLSIAPFGARIRGGPGRPGFLHPDRIASSGIRLRITTVSLETGEARYVTESGAIVHDDDQRCVSSPTEPVDLVIAVLASAAIPVLFEPV